MSSKLLEKKLELEKLKKELEILEKYIQKYEEQELEETKSKEIDIEYFEKNYDKENKDKAIFDYNLWKEFVQTFNIEYIKQMSSIGKTISKNLILKKDKIEVEGVKEIVN